MTEIKKILIANRGEIACRVIRTAHSRGIATVAVFSDADRYALHVKSADEAVHIGGSASSESYLNAEAIITAAKATNADAIHPGFGFLSENSSFATALKEAGIIFIGPDPHAIEVMGDKITSKNLAQEAGVNIVPGHPHVLKDAEEAKALASTIGCPVMLKASAGGGGKGMRVAYRLEDVQDNFISAQNEARTAFGDDRVFIEKFIEEPRHIEIQLIADSHGNCVYLGERECSIQRRHQKVIEEAPSSFISDETRKAMGEQAVALAKAVQYQSAGTVEFIVDKNQRFYFLEMNTRLQVEHPVTECITGLDIVGLMIDVAQGATLPLVQEDVVLDGWAFEARVYAEDVDRGFLPSTGRITHYQPPVSQSGVRVDTGIEAGGEISMYYDPMIAKLITQAPTRHQAIERMLQALDHFDIGGVKHNIPFLSALFEHKALQSGDLTTAFIDTYFPDGFKSTEYESSAIRHFPLIATYCELHSRLRDLQGSDGQAPTDWVTLCGDERSEISSEALASVDSSWVPGTRQFVGRIQQDVVTASVNRLSNGWQLSARGSTGVVQVLEPHVADLYEHMPAKIATDLSKYLLSPMPGLLMKILVNEGDVVSAGQDLAVIEAMKMENTLRADVDGTVKHISAAVGDSLAVDATILEFE
ncbi:MAG: acetyl/propionyl/methylcrotonyl-CoA carboxylase subunit alpha [Gammaproteobacteria bacterium]|nr:acetyl/propionyl/methylcrotonyl-CoA carboxylase subunit alpha [Gammaproteobacteria bacterium]